MRGGTHLPTASRRLAGRASPQPGEHPNALRLLPREAYISAEVFEREMDRVFGRQWLYLGHVSQVPNVGDYFVEELCGESVIVLRESAERIRGYLNVCRHRGHRLCSEPAGHKRVLTCPYHHWSYGLDGSLRRTPGGADGVFLDYLDWPLHQVQVELWHGLIFGWLSEQPAPSLASLLAFDDSAFRILETENTKEAFRESYDIAANWKVLLENYLECYHCLGAHPELSVPMDVEATYNSTLEDWQGEYFSGVLRLRPGFKTGSLDGRLVSKPLGRLADEKELTDGFGAGLGIVPTLTRVIFHVDHGLVHMLRPVDSGRVRWETRWYVRDDAIEGTDYEVERLTALWRLTNAEDIALCESAYRGVRSRRFVSGPLHPHREAAIGSALEVYRKLMDS